MMASARNATERRKSKKRREETSDKITAEEYAVAKYLRQKLPNKKTMLFNHKVDYFIASKAIDCLLDSPFAVRNKSKETLFTTRESVVEFLDTMLIHKFFHRARKIVVAAKDSSKKKKPKEESSDEKDKEKDSSKKKKDKKSADDKDKKSADDKDKKDEDKEDAKGSKKDKKKEDEEKKKKKKLKLDMHLEQLFVDGSEVFVWIYDPIPMKAWVIGGVLVIGAIVLCLFPLWPQSVRKGVYYLSIAAAGFLVFILSLAVLRLLVFCVVWAVTFGRHHIWLFPNLTEDVGFFESFWPLYKYEYRGGGEPSDGKGEGEEDEDDTTTTTNEQSQEKKAESPTSSEQQPPKVTNDQDESNFKTSDETTSRVESPPDGGATGATSKDSSSEDNEFEVLDAEEAGTSETAEVSGEEESDS